MGDQPAAAIDLRRCAAGERGVALYPALHKLEQEGWIQAEWKQTENNRRAKFYSVTRLGRKQLETETANWQRLSTAITNVVQISEA